MTKRVLTTLEFESGAGITGLQPAPSDDSAPVVNSQLKQAIEGLAWKDNVRVRAGSNINLSSPGAAIDGVTLANGDRFLAGAQSTAAQNGIYIFNGAASAATRAPDMSESSEFNSAIIPVTEGTDAGTQWRVTVVNPTVGTDPITITAFSAASPDASTTTKGIVELATDAEVNTGTDTTRAVTPASLAQWEGAARRFSDDFGDGTATQYDITHNLGTEDVTCFLRENSGNKEEVIADIRVIDANTVRVNTVGAVSSNELRITVLA